MGLSLSLYVDADTGAAEPTRLYVGGDCNITHNVSPMWRKAGVYEALYKSDETSAGQWLDALRAGLRDMEAHAETYRALNPSNGWGDYDGALRFLRAWEAVCAEHPKALVNVSA
ncbi:MAG: hypothetical protein ACYC3L_01190 [Gemmatimonadaceae bacterium]